MVTSRHAQRQFGWVTTTPRKLGSRETGGGLSLPIWIDYMRVASLRYAHTNAVVPTGIFRQAATGISAIWGPTAASAASACKTVPTAMVPSTKELPRIERATERSTILNLFRN